MAEIHGLAYIIIGVFITAFSLYIGNKTGITKLIIFIITGIVMIIICIIKLITKRTAKKQEVKPHHVASVKYCSRCGNRLRKEDNFCYKCGHRFLHHK